MHLSKSTDATGVTLKVVLDAGESPDCLDGALEALRRAFGEGNVERASDSQPAKRTLARLRREHPSMLVHISGQPDRVLMRSEAAVRKVPGLRQLSTQIVV